MRLFFRKIFRNNCGATALEYALLMAIISMAAATGLSMFTPSLNNIYVIVDKATKNKM